MSFRKCIAVNPDKIIKDLSGGVIQIQIAALTAVLQISASSVESLTDLEGLRDAISVLRDHGHGDVLFLARKSMNHLNSILSVGNDSMSSVNTEGAALSIESSESDQVATLTPEFSRKDILEIMNSSSDEREIANALSLLLRSGKGEDIKVVRGMLSHSDSRVRSNAVEFIERFGTDEEIISSCMSLVMDESNRVRGTVLSAIGRIDPSVVTSHFEEMLASNEISIRESAVYALSRIKGEWVVKLLITAMSDTFEGIRGRAADALGRQKDIRSLHALKEHLNDLSPEVVDAVQKSIAFLTMEEVQGLRNGELDCSHNFASTDVTDNLAELYPEELLLFNRADDEMKTNLVNTGKVIFQQMMDGILLSEYLSVLFCDIVKLSEFKRQNSDISSTEADFKRIENFLEKRYSILALGAARVMKSKELLIAEDNSLFNILSNIEV
jgi:hypothetical protein